MKTIFETSAGEHIVGICLYRDGIVIATTRQVYFVKNADDEELATSEVIAR